MDFLKFHAQLRHPLRIPVLLERKNASEQIVIARQLLGAAGRDAQTCGETNWTFLDPFRERIVADVALTA